MVLLKCQLAGIKEYQRQPATNRMLPENELKLQPTMRKFQAEKSRFSLIGTPELKKWLWSAYVLPLLELKDHIVTAT
uniref:Uncharacterized protein n=1 Tax=Oryza nivara TaxID=4536 RepID=A0A0E0GYH7_ORYNI